jgi:hypothetical protein
MTLSEHDIQIGQELSLINYGKVFKRLREKQKQKVVDEFIKIRTQLNHDQIENYLTQKRFGRKRK